MVYGAANSMDNVNTLYKYNRVTAKNDRARGWTPDSNASLKGGQTKSGYINSNAAKYVLSIRQNAKLMLDSLDVLTDSSAFNKMKAVSSNENYLKVESSGNDRQPRDTSLNVTQVAASQVNEGAAMKSDDKYVSSGTRRFEIDVGGKTSQFSIDVKSGETNLGVQQKMASAINGANIGVTASVEISPKNNTSVLSVSSNHTGTGENSEFVVRDVEGFLASATGINLTTQAAQDAIYSINGGEAQSSASNLIELPGGAEVTLQSGASGNVTIFAAIDTSFSKDAVKDMVDVYNSLLKPASSSQGRLSSDLTRAYEANAPALESIGITANDDGTLKIDDKQFYSAAESGELESFFNESHSGGLGFTERLSQIARTAEFNTPAYLNVSSGVTSMPQGITHNYGQETIGRGFTNNYMIGVYNNISGYLFDLYA